MDILKKYVDFPEKEEKKEEVFQKKIINLKNNNFRLYLMQYLHGYSL